MANDARSEKSSQYNSEKNQNGKEEQKEEDDEDEEDYMSMIIQEPEKFKEKETSIQRRARKERQVRVSFPLFLFSSPFILSNSPSCMSYICNISFADRTRKSLKQ